ncbi:Hypothetical protein, putative [Bodo saltans]|uniref:Leucine-rich repeat protein n=1 Tax=Bodo saltans TaxID=75058 RepID=A0A0S4J2W1_BODSA|nr:Hypothetical protein, putative [Bodo saltans]|eukprot:CUG85498.1 Hypothetical protein, putative [Bodo saltans]
MATHLAALSLRHRPEPPPALSPWLAVDYIPKGAKSIPLPPISKPPMPIPEGVPVDGVPITKQHFEIVMWLAVFACTRESPHRAVVAMDVPRAVGGAADGGVFASSAALRQSSSPGSRSGSPGGLSSFVALPPAAVGFAGRSASPLPATNHSMASLPPYSSGGSERGGSKFDVGDDVESEIGSSALTTVFADLPLAVTILQCQTIMRCLRVALRLHGGAGPGGGKGDALGFSADSLSRWISAPQQFGMNIKRTEDVLVKPPQQRRRRDAVYRNILTRLLADPLSVDYLWWCAGQYEDIYQGLRFPLFHEQDAPPLLSQSVSSSVSTLKGEVREQSTFVGGLRKHHTATGCAGKYVSLPEAPSLLELHRGQERNEVTNLFTQLLWHYVEGAMDWSDRGAVIAAASSVNKSVYISGMATPSLPRPFLRSPNSMLSLSSLTSIALVRCGLCDVSGLEYCASVQTLRLHGNRITSLPLILWTSLSQLREVDVSSNLLTSLGFEVLLPFGTLSPRGSSTSSAEVLSSPRGLSSFLSHTSISSIAGLVHLESLCASFNELLDGAVSSWWDEHRSVPTFRSLQHLDLSGNRQLSLFYVSRASIEVSAPSLKRFVLTQTSVRAPPPAPTPPVTNPHMVVAPKARHPLDIVYPCVMPTSKYLVPVGGSRRQWRSLRSVLAHVMNVLFLHREARRISTGKRIGQLVDSLGGVPSEAMVDSLVETFAHSPRSPLSSRVERLRIRKRCNKVLRFHECTIAEQAPVIAHPAQSLSTSTTVFGEDVSPSLSRLLGRKRMSSLRIGNSTGSMRK